MSAAEPTVRDAVREHDFGRMANVYALKLQTSCHAIDRAGASVAYEVALRHLRTWEALTGQTKGNA